MIRVEKLYYAPVKSLALVEAERAYLDKPGIAGDRAFYIIDERGKLITQRDHGPLVQVRPSYDAESGRLELHFPDGSVLAGVPQLGEAVTTRFWEGRPVEGHVLAGKWNDALSLFAKQELRIVKVDRPGQSFDAYPLSMCSMGSLEALASAADRGEVDGRRFRQNIYLSGAAPHEEDTWLDGEVRVGAAVLRVKMRDSRCEVTTHSPETGETDMNTLKLIASYRTDQPKEVNFGVYCTVAQPGEAAAGDAVEPLPR
jgi:uncharacterized protein YcbX